MEAEKLSNIQMELIKLYQYPVDEIQLLDIKKLLGNYFAKMDAIWEKIIGRTKLWINGLSKNKNDLVYKFHL